MIQKLFRQEAVDQYANRLYGEVILLPTPRQNMLVGISAILMCMIFLWVFSASHTVVETAPGWLERPSSRLDDGTYNKALLEVVLLVPYNIEVKLNQELEINYRDFPKKIVGTHMATVHHIENNLFIGDPVELSQKKPPAYLVKATLQSSILTVDKKEFVLVEKMTLSAVLNTKRQLFICWMLDALRPDAGGRNG
jgi:hypothetical protein